MLGGVLKDDVGKMEEKPSPMGAATTLTGQHTGRICQVAIYRKKESRCQ